MAALPFMLQPFDKLRAQHERGARIFFERWQDSLRWQRLEPYRKFAALIDSHWEGIASYCRPENRVSLGLVEGINNKIRVLQRRAYGYRDEEFLKLKIIAAFLPSPAKGGHSIIGILLTS